MIFFGKKLIYKKQRLGEQDISLLSQFYLKISGEERAYSEDLQSL